jgi:hypothetical protein
MITCNDGYGHAAYIHPTDVFCQTLIAAPHRDRARSTVIMLESHEQLQIAFADSLGSPCAPYWTRPRRRSWAMP